MDEKFTQQLQQYLAEDNPDIAQGAELLLRLTRNRFLTARILRHPEFMRPKLMSELQHHLRIRLDGMTRQDILRMEREVVPRAEESLAAGEPQPDESSEVPSDEDVEEEDEGAEVPAGRGASAPSSDSADAVYRGKRDDHDRLPQEVQQLYDRNGDVYRRMKRTFETLKQLNDRPACDRYEYLKQLKELDEAYRANWESYDHYQDGDDLTPFRPAKDVRTEHVAVAAKRIVAARKYISHNHSQLPLVTDESKRALIVAKMQERVDLILSAGESFDASYRAELEKTGLRFE